MRYRQWIACALGVALGQAALADGSYEQTTQVTGGTMKQIFAMTSAFSPSASKQMSKANSNITVVSGNRMAHISTASTVVYDLDRQTVTRIDNTRQQYAVVTFEELRKQVEAMARQMQAAMAAHKADADQASAQLPQELAQIPLSSETQVTETGATRTIEGTPAREVLLTETMTFKDPKGSNDTVTYYYKRDVWLASSVPPGYQEIEDFRKRMAEKLTVSSRGNPMAQLAGSYPGLAEGMKKLGEEMARQRGVPVMVVEQLGGRAEGDSVASANASTNPGTSSNPGASSNASANANTANTATAGRGASISNEVISGAASAAAQKEAGQLSSSGKLGSLTGSLFNSAANVFQRHSADLTRQATSSVTPGAAKPDKPASAESVLMETTTVTSNFSTEKVPAAAFEAPAGFAKTDWLGVAGGNR